MKFDLIEIEPIIKYPPAMAVLKNLTDLGYQVTLYTLSAEDSIKAYCNDNGVHVVEIGGFYDYKVSPIIKMKNLYQIRKILWEEIKKNETEDTILWVFSTITLKHLGKELLRHKYILHLFELVEHLYYFGSHFEIDLKKYCDSAFKVVVCEENRAHITQTWLKLNELPSVLPNKPYDEKIERYSSISSSGECDKLIKSLKEKKIILYQGIIDKERPLEEFIYAVRDLGDEFAFVLMSGSENPYKEIESNNFYYLNYIPAPLHLEVTSHAYIGVLSYVPNYDGYSSPLNAIYCAPNKVFEYAKFGVPMIGNNIPGLSNIFALHGIGMCTCKMDREEIKRTILSIDQEYGIMSKNAEEYYESVDSSKIIESIIENK